MKDAVTETKNALAEGRVAAMQYLCSLYVEKDDSNSIQPGLLPTTSEIPKEQQRKLMELADGFDPTHTSLPEAAATLHKLRLQILALAATGENPERLGPAIVKYYARLNHKKLGSGTLRSAGELAKLLHLFGRSEQEIAIRFWAEAFVANLTVEQCLKRIRESEPLSPSTFVPEGFRMPFVARMDAALASKLLESDVKLEPEVACEISYRQCILAKFPKGNGGGLLPFLSAGFTPGGEALPPAAPLPDVPSGQAFARAERLYATLSAAQKSRLEPLRTKATEVVRGR